MHNRLIPVGDSAILIHFGDDIDLATNRRVHALEAHLRSQVPQGILEFVPAYATLLVHYDPLLLSYAEAADWLRRQIDRAASVSVESPRRIEVPVHYGGDRGPDLPFVASYHRTTASEIVRLHTSREYTVFMMGFTPGFPYMGKLEQALLTPRLQTPRKRVPAGSVGIAGAQTGVYPIDSPGGWQIIGHTSLPLLSLDSDPPFLFAPGDTVRFIAEALDD